VRIDKRWLDDASGVVPRRATWSPARRDAPSIAGRWFSEVGEAFVEADVRQADPDPTRYITDEYMKMAAAGLPK
jgi:hypothetical protein